jgi:hypothetical protein
MVITSGLLSLVLKSYGRKVLQNSVIFTTSTAPIPHIRATELAQCWWCCFLSPASIQELACLSPHNCTLQIHFVQCCWNTGKCNAKQSTQLCHPAWTNVMASLPGPPKPPDFCQEMSPSSKADMFRHIPWLQCQNPELPVLVTCPYLYYNFLNISRHLFSVSYSSWAIQVPILTLADCHCTLPVDTMSTERCALNTYIWLFTGWKQNLLQDN